MVFDMVFDNIPQMSILNNFLDFGDIIRKHVVRVHELDL